jgi:hypothetical protein
VTVTDSEEKSNSDVGKPLVSTSMASQLHSFDSSPHFPHGCKHRQESKLRRLIFLLTSSLNSTPRIYRLTRMLPACFENYRLVALRNGQKMQRYIFGPDWWSHAKYVVSSSAYQIMPARESIQTG